MTMPQQMAGQIDTQTTAEVAQTVPNPIENPTAGTFGGDRGGVPIQPAPNVGVISK